MKEQQNQDNEHHIEANGRKRMRSYGQKMLPLAARPGNGGPDQAQSTAQRVMEADPVNRGALHGKGHLNRIRPKWGPEFQRPWSMKN